MSNYTFPCSSVNGLTLTQKRAAVAALKQSIKDDVAFRKQEKLALKADKVKAREAKLEARIAKQLATLQKLKDKANPVGTKAIKAAKRPGPVTVTKMA
jgi:hypothetical protein